MAGTIIPIIALGVIVIVLALVLFPMRASSKSKAGDVRMASDDDMRKRALDLRDELDR